MLQDQAEKTPLIRWFANSPSSAFANILVYRTSRYYRPALHTLHAQLSTLISLFFFTSHLTCLRQFIRPRDLSLEARTPRQGSKPKSLSVGPSTSEARKNDTFYKLGVDPLRCALYPSVLSQYMTEMAKIYPRRHSGLTSKSQRRIAKAIRRAKMMGIIPLHSRPRTSRPHIHFPVTSASNTQTQ
jgi:small subunit ribosomal protein S18